MKKHSKPHKSLKVAANREKSMDLYANLWATPVIYTLFGILLFSFAVWADSGMNLGNYIPPAITLEYQLTRTLLSTLTGGILSLTTFTFYGVLAALTTFSVQFSPRILKNFMMNKVTQRTLGIFIGSFQFVLLCLLFINKEGSFFFIPMLATAVIMVSVATFIIFINHIVTWLQVTNMTDNMKEESAITARNLLIKELDQYRVNDSESVIDQVPHDKSEGYSIEIEESGYIQTIDFISLIREAEKDDIIIQLEYKIGNFAFKSTPLLIYWKNHSNSIDESKYRSLIRIGKNQNEVQDIEFSMNKLVEIAIRSIGNNDPKTTIRTLYQIGDLLTRITHVSFTPYLVDENRKLRVMIQNLEFEDYLYIGFASIRHYSRENVIITTEILKVLNAIAKVIDEHDCKALWEFAVYTIRTLEFNYLHTIDRKKLYETLLKIAETTGHEAEYNRLVHRMLANMTDSEDRKEVEFKVPVNSEGIK